MPLRSFGDAELLKALIEAFGGPVPASNGLGELWNDLINAVESFSPGGTGMPIANPTGITFGTETPDSISGADSAKWVQFPSTATVLAWGQMGDSFPRVVFASGGVGGATGFLSVGDGTFDPVIGDGAYITCLHDTDRGAIFSIQGGPGQVQGPLLGDGAVTNFGQNVSPNGNLGGNGNDVAFCSGIFADQDYSLWTCTQAGDAASAVWKLVQVTSTTDPITGAATPPNAGALWQDTSGSGSLWISTGTGSGDWAQIKASAAPPSSDTATSAFGSLISFGTPIQNTLGYDVLVTISFHITAASGGTINAGVGPTSTPVTQQISPSLTGAVPVFTFSQYLPAGYYISLTTSGTITTSTPALCQVTPA